MTSTEPSDDGPPTEPEQPSSDEAGGTTPGETALEKNALDTASEKKPASDETPGDTAPEKNALDTASEKKTSGETAPEAELPDTPEAKLLAEARAAFDVGDFRLVQVHARGAAQSSDAVVRRAADDLLARTRLDLVQVGLFVACLALLLGITYWFVLR